MLLPVFVLYRKLAANNLTANQVVDAVKAQNTTAIGGLVGGPPAAGDQAYTYPLLVQNNGNLLSLEDFENLIISRTETGNLLLLKDVGEVQYGFNNYSSASLDRNSHDAVSVAVFHWMVIADFDT